MNLTDNFKLIEFACKDGSQVPNEFLPNVKKLATNLQVLRNQLEKPIVINSAYRTPKYNASVGGAKSSQHLTASAADIRINGYDPILVYETILKLIKEGKLHNGGVGLYNTFVHYDVRSTPARWNYSNNKV